MKSNRDRLKKINSVHNENFTYICAEMSLYLAAKRRDAKLKSLFQFETFKVCFYFDYFMLNY